MAKEASGRPDRIDANEARILRTTIFFRPNCNLAGLARLILSFARLNHALVLKKKSNVSLLFLQFNFCVSTKIEYEKLLVKFGLISR